MTQAEQPKRDISLLTGLDENPAFIETSLSRGAFAECGVCQRILAVGISQELAEMTATANGIGRRIGKEFRCQDHDHIERAKGGAHR